MEFGDYMGALAVATAGAWTLRGKLPKRLGDQDIVDVWREVVTGV